MTKKLKTVVKLTRINKSYYLRNAKKKQKFFALKNINLKIFKGEKLAILGDNGAGKTTLLKLIAGIAEPTDGKISVIGKVVSLIDLTAGFHPEFSGRENIYLNAVLLGMNLHEIRQLEKSIIKFSGINKFIDQALYTYSSGMVLRLGFSIAVHSHPDILILDESIVVGDNDFQKKAYDKVEEIFRAGKTIILCSHMLPLLRRLCNRFVWIDEGKIMMDGDEEVLVEYKKHRNLFTLEKVPDNKNAALLYDFLRTLPEGEKFIAHASSGSMEPLILKGDKVLVEKINYKHLKKGDIIAFWSAELNNVLVHRFYQLEKGKIITKGDSNPFADPGFVSRKNYLGVIKKII